MAAGNFKGVKIVLRATNKASGPIAAVNRQLEGLGATARRLNLGGVLGGGARIAAGALDGLIAKIAVTTYAIQTLTPYVKNLIGVAGFSGLGAAALAAGGRTEALRNELLRITGSSDEATSRITALRIAARETGIGFEEAAAGAAALAKAGVSATAADIKDLFASAGYDPKEFQKLAEGFEAIRSAMTAEDAAKAISSAFNVEAEVDESGKVLIKYFDSVKKQFKEIAVAADQTALIQRVMGIQRGRAANAQMGLFQNVKALWSTFVDSLALIGETGPVKAAGDAIGAIVKRLSDGIKPGGEFVGVIESMGKGILAFGAAVTGIGGLEEFFTLLKTTDFEALGRTIGADFAQMFSDLRASLPQIVSNIKEVARGFGQLGDAAGWVFSQIKSMTLAFNDLTGLDISPFAVAVGAAIMTLTGGFTAALGAVGALIGALRGLPALIPGVAAAGAAIAGAAATGAAAAGTAALAGAKILTKAPVIGGVASGGLEYYLNGGNLGRALAAGAGAIAGGVGGGALGSLAAPGVGTVLGGAAGAMAGESAATALYDLIVGQDEATAATERVAAEVRNANAKPIKGEVVVRFDGMPAGAGATVKSAEGLDIAISSGAPALNGAI